MSLRAHACLLSCSGAGACVRPLAHLLATCLRKRESILRCEGQSIRSILGVGTHVHACMHDRDSVSSARSTIVSITITTIVTTTSLPSLPSPLSFMTATIRMTMMISIMNTSEGPKPFWLKPPCPRGQKGQNQNGSVK